MGSMELIVKMTLMSVTAVHVEMAEHAQTMSMGIHVSVHQVTLEPPVRQALMNVEATLVEIMEHVLIL